MRPIYDDSEGREKEEAAEFRVKQRWGCDLVRLPRFSMIDRLGVRAGQLIAIFEVKGRNVSRNLYSTYEIGKAKIDAIHQMSHFCKVPAFLVVHWTDGLGFIDLAHTIPVGERWGGRTDRGDPKDQEMMYCYDPGHFTFWWTAEVIHVG